MTDLRLQGSVIADAEGPWWLGVGLILLIAIPCAVTLWRYPDLRRAVIDHWKPHAIAERIQRWTERNRRP